MRVLRIIVAVVVGYLVFAVGSMFLVGNAMTREGPLVVILSSVGLAVIGLLVGIVAAALAGAGARTAIYILTGLVVLATLVNLVIGLGAEPVWYKIGTLVLTAPAIVLAGLRRPHR